MADMLNAAHDRDNARLFNDSTGYTMRTSKAISKGEEIVSLGTTLLLSPVQHV